MLPPEFSHQPTWSLPRLQSGDGDADQVYTAVGRALSQWEELETLLGELFATFVESRSTAAARAYGTMASAQARFDLLDSAAEIYFAERAGQDDYRNIIKIIRLASPCRNNVAHGVVREYAAYGTDGGGNYLVSPEYNSRRNEPFSEFESNSIDPFHFARHKYAYTAAQITMLRDRFIALTREVGNFARQLKRPPRPTAE
jgi:hypothetical protein